MRYYEAAIFEKACYLSGAWIRKRNSFALKLTFSSNFELKCKLQFKVISLNFFSPSEQHSADEICSIDYSR